MVQLTTMATRMDIHEAFRACYEGPPRRATQKELAEATGIPQGTISNYARGETEPPARTQNLVEEVCGRPRGWMAVQAGLVELPTTIEEFIAMAPELTDDDRRALLAAYRGMVNLPG